MTKSRFSAFTIARLVKQLFFVFAWHQLLVLFGSRSRGTFTKRDESGTEPKTMYSARAICHSSELCSPVELHYALTRAVLIVAILQ